MHLLVFETLTNIISGLQGTRMLCKNVECDPFKAHSSLLCISREMNHKNCLLTADALSDLCFGLLTSHISDCEFPYKETRQWLHGATPWFWEGAACGLLGAAIWFPSLQGGLGDGRACCLITTSKSFLAPLVHVKKNVKCNFSCQAQMKPLNRPQTSCCFPRPLLIECVCVCI